MSQTHRRLAREQMLGPALIVLLATAIRAFRLGDQSLWTDEILTPLSAGGSLWRVLTQREVNTNIPPLYYVIVHFILPFGRTEQLLRLPSLLFGVASIIPLYLIVREWLGNTPALATAFLIAISPFDTWYSQEARPYTLLLFLSLLSLLLLQRLLRHPDSWSFWAASAFIVSAAATFYCHTLGLPFIAFLGAFVRLTAPRDTRGRFIPLFVAIALLLIPGFYRLIVFAPSASADAGRRFEFVFIPYGLWAFFTGYSVGPTLTELHQPTRTTAILRWAPVIIPITVLLGAILLRGAAALRAERRVVSVLLLWFLFPVAFATAGTLLTRHPFNARYLILALPPCLILAACGALASHDIWWRALAGSTLVAVSAYALNNYFFVARYQREDNRAAGRFLAAGAEPADLVIADAPYTALNLDYYAQRSDLAFAPYPARSSSDDSNLTGVLRLPAAGTGDVNRMASLAEIIAGRKRFWLFLSRTYHGVPAADVLQFCDAKYQRVRQLQTENDILLILYQSPATPAAGRF